MKTKVRLDVLVVDRGLAPSRERARAMILARQVTVDGQVAPKAGAAIAADARVELVAPDHPYVGRGGVKLAHALEAFGIDVAGRPALVARAAEARDVLPDALAERGAKVDVVPLYETVREPASEELLAAIADADYVTFTSSSTVRFFLESVGDGFPAGTRVVSIGPVTSATARELGLDVAVEAERHDPEGLVAALLADAT
jgi:uroporphyrinogen-III synthase